MSKSVNDTLGNQEKTVKQVMETVQELKTEMGAMMKTQTEVRLDMENLGKWTETTEPRITNRIQEIEEWLSDPADTREKRNALIKEKGKTNKFSSQYIQEIWGTIIKPNLRIIDVTWRPALWGVCACQVIHSQQVPEKITHMTP